MSGISDLIEKTRRAQHKHQRGIPQAQTELDFSAASDPVIAPTVNADALWASREEAEAQFRASTWPFPPLFPEGRWT